MYKQDLVSWINLITKFTYKPGWHFEVYDNRGWEFPSLNVQAEVIDSRDRTTSIKVHCTRGLGPFINQTLALQRLRSIVREVEMHESDEWFRYKDQIIFDPHISEKDKALIGVDLI